MLIRKDSTKGFTLIELLVVIAIIGVLASIVLASLNSARQRGRDTKRVGDVRNLQVALELYFDDNGEYPENITDLSPAYVPVDALDPTDAVVYRYNTYTQSYTVASPPVAGGDCAGAESCVWYQLGASLENSGHTVLDNDFDAAGEVVDGVDADGCNNEASRYCYSVSP